MYFLPPSQAPTCYPNIQVTDIADPWSSANATNATYRHGDSEREEE